MSAPVRKRGFLLTLAAEAIAPAVVGCARALAGAPAGAAAVLGQPAPRAISFFGQHIVRGWADWLRGQPRAVQIAAVAELADLPPDRARREAAEAVDRLAPDAAPEDRAAAVEFLS